MNLSPVKFIIAFNGYQLNILIYLSKLKVNEKNFIFANEIWKSEAYWKIFNLNFDW